MNDAQNMVASLQVVPGDIPELQLVSVVQNQLLWRRQLIWRVDSVVVYLSSSPQNPASPQNLLVFLSPGLTLYKTQVNF